jgi:hypothetical protein
MYRVIDKLSEVLFLPPALALSSAHVGSKKPSGADEIPAIVVSLTIEENKGRGLGRFIRAGEMTVQSSAVIEAKPGPEAFSGDLRTLRLHPVPVKKNPSSTEGAFGEDDVQVRNVTHPASPVPYKMTAKPVHQNEYSLDVPQTRIVFGAAQSEGDKLEVVHWTIDWRNDIYGERYKGEMILEIWSNSFDGIKDVSRRVEEKLKSHPTALRQRGFLNFQPALLEPAESILYDPPASSPFPVWKQKLGYKFTFETEEGGEISTGIPIKRINVDADRELKESYTITKETG